MAYSRPWKSYAEQLERLKSRDSRSMLATAEAAYELTAPSPHVQVF
jgi:abortive infection bacteriophage resistance protein